MCGEVQVVSRLLVDKIGCGDKAEHEAETEEIVKTRPAYHPVNPLSGILTPDVLRMEECLHAPETQKIVGIGWRSMKLTDNEIWPGSYKDEIRPASHLYLRF